MATAEAGPTHPALAHEGAWTEDAYLALPGDHRVELVDGSLLVGPTTGDEHDQAVAIVRAAVEAALPDGLEVDGPMALRLSPGRILVPDLVVSARPTPDTTRDGNDVREGPVRDGSVALVVIDVVGRGNGVADRWFKPQLYAGSRIPYALLVDHDAPFAVGSMLIGGRYHEYAGADGGGVLRLEEPFPLELDLAAFGAGLDRNGAHALDESAAEEPAAEEAAAAGPAADGPVPTRPAAEPDGDEPARAGPAGGAAPEQPRADEDRAVSPSEPASDPVIR